MQLASLAFAALALAAPGAPANDPAPAIQSQAVQVTGGREFKRRFGLGANFSTSTREAGGAFRYWFGDRIGLDMAVLWARPTAGTGRDGGSTFIVAPSLMYLLIPHDNDRDVNLLPYIGGGINYARQSGRPDDQGGPANGAGGQFFGGVELSFQEMPHLVISVSVVRYWLPEDFFGLSTSFERTRVLGSIYLYF